MRIFDAETNEPVVEMTFGECGNHRLFGHESERMYISIRRAKQGPKYFVRGALPPETPFFRERLATLASPLRGEIFVGALNSLIWKTL